MEFDLIHNAMHSLNEAIDYYSAGKENNKPDLFKFSILLTCHCAELLLKEILHSNHPVLIYESIDDYDYNVGAKLTIGFVTALKRIKRTCNIDLGIYRQYLDELSSLRNMMQHFKFSVEEAQCQKVMVQSFSAIEHILTVVLKREFSEFEDVLSPATIEYLRDDEAAYSKRKEDISIEIKRQNLDYFTVGYTVFSPERKEKRIKVPCPSCGEHLLTISTDGKIKCHLCRKEFLSHNELHENDSRCIVSDEMEREIGRRKHEIPYTIYECENCDYDALIFNPKIDSWVCWVCGHTIGNTISCDDCGIDLPDSEYYYRIALSYFDTDDYKYLCLDCAKQMENSDHGSDYEIR